MKTIVFLTALLLSASSYADGDSRPKGPNCALNDPPVNAGEVSGHGLEARVFPRLKDIKRDYTGCQVMWAQYENAWWKVGVTEIVHGEVIRMWTRVPSENLELKACNYKNGKGVSDNSESCPSDLDGLPAHSVPSGCTQKWKSEPALDLSQIMNSECAFD